MGGPRTSLRDPSHPDWPSAGARTTDERVAQYWARAYLDHYQQEHVRSALGQPKAIRLDKAVRDYLEARKPPLLALNTWRNIRSALRQIIVWAGADTPTNRILLRPGRDRVRGYLYLQDLVNKRVADGYEISTVHTWVSFWSPFFKWLGSKLDFSELAVPRVPPRDVRPWTDSEVTRIRRAAGRIEREPHWPDPVLVVEWYLASGCRQEEGYAAEWSRIRRGDCTVRLVGQLGDGGSIQPLKGRLNRSALLLPHWWKQPQRKAGYVLASPDGSVLQRSAQQALLYRVLDKAGLYEPRAAYHRFRHTYSRLVLEGGGRLEELQIFLGHSSIATTERIYGWLSESKAAQRARSVLYAAQ